MYVILSSRHKNKNKKTRRLVNIGKGKSLFSDNTPTPPPQNLITTHILYNYQMITFVRKWCDTRYRIDICTICKRVTCAQK